ncbi:MAG: hypothetical protein Kow0032_08820 [Methyloligellaceae bacterium]
MRTQRKETADIAAEGNAAGPQAAEETVAGQFDAKLRELIEMAHSHRLEFLAYLLTMARVEALEAGRKPASQTDPHSGR